MTELLYLDTAYRTEFNARVLSVGERGLELDRTLFYPDGGGQPSDEGELELADGRRVAVHGVEKADGVAWHRTDASVEVGTAVRGRIGWERRYLHMRYHTAVHLLSGAAFARFGADITGSQLSTTGARVDLVVPEARRETAEALVAAANREVAADRPIEVRWVASDELARSPSLVRVRRDLVPVGERLRLIDIVGFDVQADGGTHVRSTAEVGEIRLERFENKGARNKRLYVALPARPPPAPDLP